MKNRKIIIILILSLIILSGTTYFLYRYYQYLKIKNAKIEIVLKDDLTLNFYDNKKVSDFISSINGKILDDYKIDSTKLGEKVIKFQFINDENIKLNYEFTINVIDDVPPLIWLNDTYSISKNSDIDLVENILCGDNYDNNPKCFIEGDYNLDEVGKYPLIFKAIDNSNNVASKEFILNVYEPDGTSSNNYTSKKIEFSEVIENYKTENTKIGLDISEWQGDVDYEKLKNAGVEFVILRVGRTKGINGVSVIDDKFIQNITNANNVGIDVGLYYYSYANSTTKAREEAEWVIKQIKDYKVDLPIAFDWEEWSNFNKYNLSFFNLTNVANEFIKTIENAGYKGMLYSSKTYLENMWLKTDNITWLAHYTDKTTYKGDYLLWQLCNTGRVDGIYGDVDINVMYLN